MRPPLFIVSTYLREAGYIAEEGLREQALL